MSSGSDSRPPVAGKSGPSTSAEPHDSAQLSGADGVNEGVSSVALKQVGFAGLRVPAYGAAPVDGALAQAAAAELSDSEIMLRVKAGDDSAFDYLVQKFRRSMVGFMYRMARNQAVAEELAQEVFLRVYRSRESYAAEAKFSTWLYRIATNLALNHLRDTKSERTEVSVSLDEPDEESGRSVDVADSHCTIEEELLRRERMAQIRKQVEALPERQRMAVIMHKYQEMDYREISAVLKMSESATKSLLFRAYETLREKLKGLL
ncbi:MAG TPA: sigma-70 family RNA polymerase sigma factor [Terriglobales bacterium]|jgi:RNA polymerase sigma-70 factor (ECF subfamily)|nr:sigma-70 family RNA polymerase sigma factor [Terriglobales bacterium]